MMLQLRLIFILYSLCASVFKVAGTKSKAKGSQGQFPITQNVTVVEGGTANMTCRVDYNDNTSLQWSNPAQQTLFFGDKKALRDHRIELVRASSQELTIRINDVSLSDEGQYTCSLFTMPVKTTKAFLTVLGVPSRPEITGFAKPAMEKDVITLTCTTSGSKPAANIRWFRNDKEVQGTMEVNATGKSFTVKSSLQFQVNKQDDGVAYTCSVEHVSLSNPYMTTEVLEVHYPNALGQHGPDHALIGGVVAVVVFITLCLIIVLGRYLARHKGTYLTHEAKGSEDAPDADTAIINAEGNHVHAEEKKEYFI
ncbi:cell adhesion molecule 2 isoform X4 [Austrofundulus limnaeus]|uniref:Cell adhesion molecule 2 isoform X4 n=1 Tax=Austrofundulus limnaeus TaxID=52670 RepID=A0A2I4BKD4_AUSLI|nr:PREDICTED: cell adhesion molecule 2-like isoform X4 [Austrofundulus limnaeus]